MRVQRLVFFLIITAFITGCATGGVILRETPLNVSETRKISTTIIGVPLRVSENGRELYSRYQDSRGNPIEKPENVRTRYQTIVTILGSRRPYDVQVQVNKEERDLDGVFEVVDQDDSRATTVSERLRKALHQSRENRNVIDDFRSF